MDSLVQTFMRENQLSASSVHTSLILRCAVPDGLPNSLQFVRLFALQRGRRGDDDKPQSKVALPDAVVESASLPEHRLRPSPTPAFESTPQRGRVGVRQRSG